MYIQKLPNVTSISLPGHSHITENGKTNQDCARSVVDKNKNITVLAVADGHGGSLHENSHYGSLFAVEIAVRLLKEFLEKNKVPQERQLPKKVKTMWDRTVLEHAKLEHELFNKPLDITKDVTLKKYGTTLLAAGFSETTAVFLQIGDGAILVSEENQNSLLKFKSEKNKPNSTTLSLSQSNIADYCDFCVERDPKIKLCLLVSDGIYDPFDSIEDFQIEMGENLYNASCDNWIKTIAALPRRLCVLSEETSGDDVSLALAVWRKKNLNNDNDEKTDRNLIPANINKTSSSETKNHKIYTEGDVVTSDDDCKYTILGVIYEDSKSGLYKVKDESGKTFRLCTFNERKSYEVDLSKLDKANFDLFLWPIKSFWKNNIFIYITPTLETRFIPWGGRAKSKMSNRILMNALANLCEAFSYIHALGLVFGSFELRSFSFDPKQGNIKISELVSIRKENSIGSPNIHSRFLAPEISKKQMGKYNRHSENHALAVLLFWTWVGRHPSPTRKFDSASFDHKKHGVDLLNHWRSLPHWNGIPLEAQQYFIKTFSEGLFAPENRPSSENWKNLFETLLKTKG
ncbi:PP2C family serine/threonine-protein phosphatase [Teredinibacter turnerae]|uniref:PP2C family serine/threonine-protein phosphatase n=1 Tax=Teredinibacter turnerae TaxID=2426 RepID=UPI0003802008|nr:PP2C family serine/threonine-protein phosphatase [Teredinibacter turnerae]